MNPLVTGEDVTPTPQVPGMRFVLSEDVLLTSHYFSSPSEEMEEA